MIYTLETGSCGRGYLIREVTLFRNFDAENESECPLTFLRDQLVEQYLDLILIRYDHVYNKLLANDDYISNLYCDIMEMIIKKEESREWLRVK